MPAGAGAGAKALGFGTLTSLIWPLGQRALLCLLCSRPILVRAAACADGLPGARQAELINGTHMYLWGMPAAVSWVQRTAGGLRAGALPSHRFLSPALANAADAGDGRTGWLDGPDAALRGFCCGGKAVLVRRRLGRGAVGGSSAWAVIAQFQEPCVIR